MQKTGSIEAGKTGFRVDVHGDIQAGFQIYFDECIISVQFGTGAYCQNRNFVPQLPSVDVHGRTIMSENAEVAVLDRATGTFITARAWRECFTADDEEPDQVVGYVGVDNLLKLARWCRSYVATEPQEQTA